MLRFTFQTYKRLLVLFLIFTALVTSAQSSKTIVHTYGYFIVRAPGNIPASTEEVMGDGKDNGKHKASMIDTSIVIYVETKDKKLTWDTARQKEQRYLIEASLIDQFPVMVGYTLEGKASSIRPSKQNYLWLLRLVPVASGHQPIKPVTRNKVVITGKYKGKKIIVETKPLVYISPINSV